MSDDQRFYAEPLKDQGSLLALVVLAPATGAVAGFVAAIFRLLLERADKLRDAMIAWGHNEGLAGFVVVTALCGAATALAAWMVRQYSPHASGSGIPHVEAVLNQQLPQAPFQLIAVKFCGGLLAIGSGLALGREGPSVQMGASIAHLMGLFARRKWPDCRVLLAAGAGAGLATAFNAPIAGAIFVLEELVRQFELRVAIAALGASATAISVSRLLLGDAPDFHVEAMIHASVEIKSLYFALGAFAGLAAIAYNRSLLGALSAVDRLRGWPVELRAALIGTAVGVLAWFAPGLVGGGDLITQRTLAGAETLALLPFVFLLRLALGAISYAAGTPGGLFAPMLALGAQLGLLFGLVCRLVFPDLHVQPEGFALVGMAAFFTGAVRAPLTGMVLVTEMTGSIEMLLPMVGACFLAMLVPSLLGDPPIYDSLRKHTVRAEKTRQTHTSA
jgi:CIC family chloride channel protein